MAIRNDRTAGSHRFEKRDRKVLRLGGEDERASALHQVRQRAPFEATREDHARFCRCGAILHPSAVSPVERFADDEQRPGRHAVSERHPRIDQFLDLLVAVEV